MARSPLANLTASSRRFLTVGCIILFAVFAFGTLWSMVVWFSLGPDSEVYFPGRGGNTSVKAWMTTLLYGALTGFAGWGIRSLLKSRPK